MLLATGLRLFSEGIPGVEVWHDTKVVAHFKRKPQAHAFVQGVWYWTQLGSDRTSPGQGKAAGR